jgi:hypothetical protein
MWVIYRAGQEPSILSNSPDDSLQAMRQRNADAAFYVCRVDGAYGQVAAHINAAEQIPIEQPGEPDAEGNPTTIVVNEWQPVGNTVEVNTAAPRLVLLDPDGEVVSTLPLALVP